MPGSVLGPCVLLLVTAYVLPPDALRTVLVAGLVIVAGVFVVRVAVHVRRHLRQPSPGRTTGETAPRPGPPVLRPLSSAGVSGSPTPLTPAGPGSRGDAA